MFGFGSRRTRPKVYGDFDKMAEALGEKDGTDVIRAPRYDSRLLYKTNPNAKWKGSLRWKWPESKVEIWGEHGEEQVTRAQRAALKGDWGRNGARALLCRSYTRDNVAKILERFGSSYGRDLSTDELTSGDIYRLRQIKDDVLSTDGGDSTADSGVRNHARADDDDRRIFSQLKKSFLKKADAAKKKAAARQREAAVKITKVFAKFKAGRKKNQTTKEAVRDCTRRLSVLGLGNDYRSTSSQLKKEVAACRPGASSAGSRELVTLDCIDDKQKFTDDWSNSDGKDPVLASVTGKNPSSLIQDIDTDLSNLSPSDPPVQKLENIWLEVAEMKGRVDEKAKVSQCFSEQADALKKEVAARRPGVTSADWRDLLTLECIDDKQKFMDDWSSSDGKDPVLASVTSENLSSLIQDIDTDLSNLPPSDPLVRKLENIRREVAEMKGRVDEKLKVMSKIGNQTLSRRLKIDAGIREHRRIFLEKLRTLVRNKKKILNCDPFRGNEELQTKFLTILLVSAGMMKVRIEKMLDNSENRDMAIDIRKIGLELEKELNALWSMKPFDKESFDAMLDLQKCLSSARQLCSLASELSSR